MVQACGESLKSGFPNEMGQTKNIHPSIWQAVDTLSDGVFATGV